MRKSAMVSGRRKWHHYKWDEIVYFQAREFEDPDYPRSSMWINMELVWDMDLLREQAGCPIVTHWKVGGVLDKDGTHGHAPKSYHRVDMGGRACDFHFVTDASPRQQANWVFQTGLFTGIGIYYDWYWNGVLLPIGFHVDLRPAEQTQIWVRENKQYRYLLK